MNPIYVVPFESMGVNEGGKQTLEMSSMKRVQSKQLFGDAKEIFIAHFGDLYILTITKQKKLLLTKLRRDAAL